MIGLESETKKYITLKFNVIDNGIGISKEQQLKIFEAFSQADSSTTRQFGGTGLGLSISAQLVRLMGGEIGVVSEPNQGANFYFTARFLKPQSKYVAVEDRLQNVANVEPLPLAILVAEDNIVNQKLIVSILEKVGHKVTLANNGLEAVEKCKTDSFDIILMDMQMPVMGGEEATLIIKKQSNNKVPIVALTAHAMAEDRQRYLSAGLDAYVAKPINRKELYSVIKDLTDKSVN